MDIEKTVRKHSDMVYRLAFSRTCNSHDAEDIMQEVFLKLMKSGKTFSDDEHEKAWLIRVTLNEGKNLVTSARKRREVSDEAVGDTVGEVTAVDEISRLETKAVVLPAVMALDEKYRTIIHLFYYEELQINEICQTTGLGESTVKSRLHRARKILKEKLKGVDFNE